MIKQYILQKFIKRSIIVLGVYFTCLSTVAQTKDCYTEWFKKFEERGADPIDDGNYSDVIITFRKAGHSNCFTGSASVKDSKVESFFLEEENGQLKKISREWESDLKNITITSG